MARPAALQQELRLVSSAFGWNFPGDLRHYGADHFSNGSIGSARWRPLRRCIDGGREAADLWKLPSSGFRRPEEPR
jgi:hypothetical protein